MAEAPQSKNGLERKFGGWTGLFVVVASMVGTGILTTSGFTIQSTGSHAALLLLWTIGGMMALCGALTLTELATAMPKVGGDYVYVREAYGPAAGFVFGWSTLLFGFAAPSALVAQASVDYLLEPWRRMGGSPIWAAQPAYGTAAATLILAALTITHCLGHRESSWTQAATTAFKFVTLVLLVAVGFWCGSGDWGHWQNNRPLLDQRPTALAQSLLYIIYSYSGWEAAVYLAGEIREPARALPRCMIGGCVIVTVLYLATNLLYGFALDPREVATMTDEQIGPIAALAASRLFGTGVANLFSVLVGLGILASLSAYLLAGARVAYAMARDGLVPSIAGQLHSTAGVPLAATIALGVFSIGLLWTRSFRELVDFTSFGLFLLAALVVSSIFRLRPAMPGPNIYRMRLYPLPPLTYLAISVWVAVYEVAHNPVRSAACLACMAAAVPVYAIVRRFK